MIIHLNAYQLPFIMKRVELIKYAACIVTALERLLIFNSSENVDIINRKRSYEGGKHGTVICNGNHNTL